MRALRCLDRHITFKNISLPEQNHQRGGQYAQNKAKQAREQGNTGTIKLTQRVRRLFEIVRHSCEQRFTAESDGTARDCEHASANCALIALT